MLVGPSPEPAINDAFWRLKHELNTAIWSCALTPSWPTWFMPEPISWWRQAISSLVASCR